MVTGGTCDRLLLVPAELTGAVKSLPLGKGRLILEVCHQPQLISGSQSFQPQPSALSVPVFELGYDILDDPKPQGLLGKPVEKREPFVILLRQWNRRLFLPVYYSSAVAAADRG